jgi:uncharacterized protein YeaO (DUF488 family)
MVPAGRTIDGAGQVVRPRPERFEEFSQRYRAELEDPERAKALQHLGELAKNRTVTLLTATKRLEISEAVVLAGLLRG